MAEMYDDLLEEYKNSVFQVSKICKGFMKKIHWNVQLFRNKIIERFSLTSQTEHPN